MTKHAALFVHAITRTEHEGITGIVLRCERCNNHLHYTADGFVLDEGCSDAESHVIPETLFNPSHGGGPRGPDDSDTVNELLQKTRL